MIGRGGPESPALGQHGSTFIDNTTSNSGEWGIIYALEDTTFTALTSGNGPDGTALMKPGTGIANLNGLLLFAGQAIFGFFTTIELASGSIVAYKC